jgi:5-bromo-4-chloroindolyl phosphate hydrolysis protein
MTKPSTQELIAFGGGMCVFIGGMVGFPTGPFLDFVLSIGLATATVIGLTIVQQPSKPSVGDVSGLKAMAAAGSNIDTKEVIDAITLGTTKLAAIRAAALEIRAPNTQRRIKKICEVGDKIVEDFRVDPKDVKLARTWLNTYLDQTLDIVKKYAQLSRTGAANMEAQKIMADCEETLDLIDEKFKELLAKLLANDVLDLDVDNTVLKNMLNQEGI